MREEPWLERPVSRSQFRIFQAVVVRHSLCQSWIRWGGLRNEKAQELLVLFRTFPDRFDLKEVQAWCDTWIATRTVDEALEELLREVRDYEAVLAEEFLDRLGLDRASYDEGHRIGKDYFSEEALPLEMSGDHFLKSIALVLHQACFSWLERPSDRAPLVEREADRQISWLMLECPHQDSRVHNRRVADFICKQHVAWFNGFIHALGSQISISKEFLNAHHSTCRLSLSLHGGDFS